MVGCTKIMVKLPYFYSDDRFKTNPEKNDNSCEIQSGREDNPKYRQYMQFSYSLHTNYLSLVEQLLQT